MSSSTLAELDDCIRATKARLDLCVEKSKPSLHAPFDGDMMSAATLAERQLRDLHQQRTKLLAGEVQPPPPPPAPTPAPLSMPTDSKDPPPLTPAQRDQPVTFGMLLSAVDGLAPAIRSYVEEGLAPLAQRIAVLEGRRVPAVAGQASGESLASTMNPDLNPVNAAIAPLLARLEALEQRPALSYRGVFKQGSAYREGSLTTHNGGLWLARADSTQRPGSGAEWTLIVKSGGAT